MARHSSSTSQWSLLSFHSPPPLVAKFQDFQTFPGRGNGSKGGRLEEEGAAPSLAAAAFSYAHSQRNGGSHTHAFLLSPLSCSGRLSNQNKSGIKF